MGVLTYEMEISSTIPPAKLFKAFVLDLDSLFPKILPHAIKQAKILHGDGGPGTIKQVIFGDGSQFKWAKHRVDELDQEKLNYAYTVIEGDALMGKLEKIGCKITMEGAAEGGTTCKSVSKYYLIGDTDIPEDQIKDGKDKAMAIFRAVESFLLANPNAY